MERLKELLIKRKEIGSRVLTNDRKENYNTRLEYEHIGQLILVETQRLYDSGELNDFGVDTNGKE